MTSGTDHDYWTDEDDAAFVPRLMAREQLEDAAYDVRAWAHGVAWLALCGAVGAAFTAISVGDYLALATALTAAVAVFLPRLDPRIVLKFFRTEFMRRGLVKRPAGEVLIMPMPANRRRDCP